MSWHCLVVGADGPVLTDPAETLGPYQKLRQLEKSCGTSKNSCGTRKIVAGYFLPTLTAIHFDRHSQAPRHRCDWRSENMVYRCQQVREFAIVLQIANYLRRPRQRQLSGFGLGDFEVSISEILRIIHFWSGAKHSTSSLSITQRHASADRNLVQNSVRVQANPSGLGPHNYTDVWTESR